MGCSSGKIHDIAEDTIHNIKIALCQGGMEKADVDMINLADMAKKINEEITINMRRYRVSLHNFTENELIYLSLYLALMFLQKLFNYSWDIPSLEFYSQYYPGVNYRLSEHRIDCILHSNEYFAKLLFIQTSSSIKDFEIYLLHIGEQFLWTRYIVIWMNTVMA